MLIISKNGKNAKKVETSVIEQENYLQQYIYDNPESIPIYDIKEDIKICILGREVTTNSGPIDAFGIDQNGSIYIIETKLYKNPDKRLVVAQVLDYGASLWKNSSVSFESLISLFDTDAIKKFNLPLVQRIKEFFQLGNSEEVQQLLDDMKNNLNHGNFKFIVLMDKLHSRLKDLILFINENSEFDIYAVELEYYKYEEYEILIPKLFGTEVKKEVNLRGMAGERKKWNENDFFTDINSKLDQKYVTAIKTLFDFSKKEANSISWGTGSSRGSFNPKFDKISVRSPYSVYTDGTLALNFGWLNDSENTKKIKLRYGELLSNVNDLSIPKNFAEIYVQIPIERWSFHVDEIIEILKQLI
jgi:hypothetical protein